MFNLDIREDIVEYMIINDVCIARYSFYYMREQNIVLKFDYNLVAE